MAIVFSAIFVRNKEERERERERERDLNGECFFVIYLFILLSSSTLLIKLISLFVRYRPGRWGLRGSSDRFLSELNFLDPKYLNLIDS